MTKRESCFFTLILRYQFTLEKSHLGSAKIYDKIFYMYVPSENLCSAYATIRAHLHTRCVYVRICIGPGNAGRLAYVAVGVKLVLTSAHIQPVTERPRARAISGKGRAKSRWPLASSRFARARRKIFQLNRFAPVFEVILSGKFPVLTGK